MNLFMSMCLFPWRSKWSSWALWGWPHCPYFGWLQWILGLLHESETVRLQLELQREHLDVVLQLDHLDSGLGWCIKGILLAQGWRTTECKLYILAALYSIGLAANSAATGLGWREHPIILSAFPICFWYCFYLGVLPHPDWNCLHPTASKDLA